MKFKVLSCRVFQPEFEAVRAESPHEFELEFVDIAEHLQPAVLRRKLQQRIDETGDGDAILLGYGLCGTAAAGLCARRIPLVLFRSHDCGGVLLGSRCRFEQIFRPMPSTPFASAGMVSAGQPYFSDGMAAGGGTYAEWVEQYGEEAAQYLRDALHPRLDGRLQPIFFIHTVPAPEAVAACRACAAQEEREFRELEGSLRLVRMLLAGDWPEADFLVVPPGNRVQHTGDWERIMASAPPPKSRSCRPVKHPVK